MVRQLPYIGCIQYTEDCLVRLSHSSHININIIIGRCLLVYVCGVYGRDTLFVQSPLYIFTKLGTLTLVLKHGDITAYHKARNKSIQ